MVSLTGLWYPSQQVKSRRDREITRGGASYPSIRGVGDGLFELVAHRFRRLYELPKFIDRHRAFCQPQQFDRPARRFLASQGF
jgi:hypothetical protein